MRLLFVTGTDTDVGKTVVTAGLLRAAARAGRSTLGIKPVAAGCERVDGQLRNDDALRIQQEATVSLPYEVVNPVALEPAIAPHIAAAQAGVELRVAALADHCLGLASHDPDWMVVEGAGGWLVPLGARKRGEKGETLADLAEALSAEVLLVVGMRLGCLSHALLTVADLTRRGLRLAGWVACCIDRDMSERAANRATLEERIDAPFLGEVPFVAESGDAVIEAAATHLLWSRLEAGGAP